MAVITGSTFDPLKARCNVRLQQGVPIVDADWNELDDIRKFELRAYLKWYVGDGIPDNSDGFRIDANGAADDFVIRAGAPAAPGGTGNFDLGLRFAGRCVVDGLDVMIRTDVTYKAQALFAGPGLGGAPQVQPIPVISGPVVIYLDVWERLVTSQEDPSLVLNGLGTESCARMKREWVVRTRAGANVPAPGDADFVAGHSYYALAGLNRRLTAPNVPATIVAADLTDRRHKRLSVAALETRLATLESMLLLPAFTAPGTQLIPKSGTVGQAIDLKGRNLNLGTPVVMFGSVQAALSGTPASNDVKVTVPNLPAGIYNVSIKTDGGGPIVADDKFTVVNAAALAPTFNAANSVVPTSANAGDTIQLNGTNFNQPGLQVSFGGTPAAVVSATATQILVTVPFGLPLMPVTIVVTTNAGSVASPVQFLWFF